MPSRRILWSQLALLLCIALAYGLPAKAQDTPEKHGRKYKAPPATSHIQVTVLKKFNGKPISNAAVIFDATMDGKDQGNLEVKTDPEGKATIDVIPTGSTVRVQVIATGFATYADEYQVTEPSREITVSMVHPQEQLSSYQDNQGKAATRKPGVQEPVRPTKPAAKPTTPAPSPQTAPQQPPNVPDTTPKQ
jgi:Carboxypeptidase regulatory-like domain